MKIFNLLNTGWIRRIIFILHIIAGPFIIAGILSLAYINGFFFNAPALRPCAPDLLPRLVYGYFKTFGWLFDFTWVGCVIKHFIHFIENDGSRLLCDARFGYL